MKKITKNNNLINSKSLKIALMTLFLSTALAACGGSGDEPESPKPKIISEVVNCLGAELDDKTSCVALDDRQAILYKNDNNEKNGIALFLHGAPGSADKVMAIFDAKMIASKHNLVALSPEGLETTWGWLSTNAPNGIENRDVDYINELIIKVKSEHNITSDNLYIFGYSAGGFMAYKLACVIPEQITAIISLAGQYRGDLGACSNSTPLPIHHFHNPSDKEVPYLGREFGSIRSVEETIELWRNKNGCDVSASSQEQVSVAPSSNKTITLTYNNCLASVLLSQILLAEHEASYISENLYEIYQYIFKK